MGEPGIGSIAHAPLIAVMLAAAGLVACGRHGLDRVVPVVPVPSDAAERLSDKAAWFEQRIGNRHLTAEGLLVYQGDAASPDIRPTAYADMAIWSGLYLAAESYRFHATRDPAARDRIDRVLAGLNMLASIPGVEGVVARAIQPRDLPPDPLPNWRPADAPFAAYRWLGNVSVDQVLGVVYGYSAAADVVGEGERREIARRVAGVVDRISRHGMHIVDADDRPVKHGDLSDSLLSENLNALIALAIFKAAAALDPAGPHEQRYRDLIDRDGYDQRAVRARDRWWEHVTGVNHSDNNLAMLAYDLLLARETDPALRATYLRGLARTWRVARSERNALFTFIAASHGLDIGDDARQAALRTLLEFPRDQRDWGIVNSARDEVCVAAARDRTGDIQGCVPLPVYERPAGPFEWNQNPYRLDGFGEGRQEYSGLGYVFAYWLGRDRGLIEAPGRPVPSASRGRDTQFRDQA